MSDLGPEAKNLLRDAMDGDDLAPADKARLRGQLLARVAVAGAAGAGAALATKSAAAKAGSAALGAGASLAPPAAAVTAVVGSSLLPKVGLAVLLVGTLAGGAVAVRGSSAPTSAPVEQVQVAPNRVQDAPKTIAPPERVAPVAETAPPVAAEPAPTNPPSAPPARAAAPRSAPNVAAPVPPAASASTLEAETRLLRGARDALQAGDGARALSILDQHALAFPSGALSEERTAQRVFALCALGRVDAARAEAGVFLAAHPSSPLASRVRSSCGRP